MFRYIEVFESRVSVLERVKKTVGEGGVKGKDAGKERDRGLRGDRERGVSVGAEREGLKGIWWTWW